MIDVLSCMLGVLPWGLPSRWGWEEWCAYAPDSHTSHLCLLLLLDSCLQILFGSDSFQISLASHSSLAPIFLIQGSFDSPNLRTLYFDLFLQIDPCEPINLSHLSLYILLSKPGSQKNWPQTIEFYELLGWLLPWKFGINIYNRFFNSFSLGWVVEVYMTKKLPS